MKRYKTNFSEQELKKALSFKEKEALELIDDLDKWTAFKDKVENFIHKANKIPVLGGLVDEIISFVQIVDAYIKKDYNEVPFTSILSVVAALIYLLSPVDLIPDIIPVIGFLDDAAIVLLVLSLGLDHDLKKFKEWQEECRIEALIELEKSTGTIITEILGDDYLGTLVLNRNNCFQVLVVDKEYMDERPYATKVYSLNIPVDILRDMYIESEDEYLKFLNYVLKYTDFKWSPIGKLDAIHEDEFDKYEDYFGLMEGENFDE